MFREFSVKAGFTKIFSLMIAGFILLMLAGPSFAAPTAGGELRVLFGIDSEYSGFAFDGLTLNFNAELTSRDGVRGEFNYDGNAVDTLAYYYLNDVFRNDEFNIGLFSIDWASENSHTMKGSLAEIVQQGPNKLPSPPHNYGFDQGVGVKYLTSFDQFKLTASVSEEAERNLTDGTDLVVRGAFTLNPNLEIGVSLASVNGREETENSDFGLLIDAGYTTGPLNFLFEVLSVNSRREGSEEKENNSGFYVEAAYEASQNLLFYGGFFAAEDLTDDLVTAGLKTRISPYATVQGEIHNTRDDWDLALGLTVNF